MQAPGEVGLVSADPVWSQTRGANVVKKATSVPALRHMNVENRFCSDPLERTSTRMNIKGHNSTVHLESTVLSSLWRSWRGHAFKLKAALTNT